MKIMIIDGNSIINRAFYGVRLLTTRDGLYTNAVFGFLSILFKQLDEESPEAVCVCFDLKAPTFRHKAYVEYKAGRRAMPDELAMQLPLVKEVLQALGIACMEKEGYEADDLLGTLACTAKRENAVSILVTGDRDSLQLVDGHTTLKLTKTRAGQSETTVYDPAMVMEEYGVSPQQMIEVKALAGDASDNIPGVRGVGEKTALELVRKYGGIDSIYEKLDELDIRPALADKLRQGKESAYLSRMLGTIDCNVPVETDFSKLKIGPRDEKRLYEILQKLEMKTFIARLGLSPAVGQTEKPVERSRRCERVCTAEDAKTLLRTVGNDSGAAFYTDGALSEMAVCAGGVSYFLCESELGTKAWCDFLRAFFGVPRTGHDTKPVLLGLWKRGIPFAGPMFDVSIACYVLGKKQELEALASERGVELPQSGRRIGLFDNPEENGGEYHCACAELLYDAAPELTREIGSQGMSQLFYEIELPLVEVMAHMQYAGFRVDRKQLQDFGLWLDGQIRLSQDAVFASAGEEFNIHSTKKLGEILFEKLGLPALRKTKTGYSTDADVLKKLAPKHPIIEAVLTYRQLTKLKSTYVEGLMKVVSEDGRIHSSFHQTGTVTGRISSSDPNMQNIPVRTELGGEIRRMFIPEEGYLLADADYSQIELRVLAHISGDETMKRAFTDGEDIHRITASQVFGVAPEQVTSAQRSAAKAVNFGIVYGISDFSLAEDIRVSRAEARHYIDRYFEKYSGVRAYMDGIVEKARETGYVETLTGRRRYVPEIRSSNFNIRSAAERIALNTPIQGTAADIIKLAMVRVYARLKREGLRSRLILQVHDELIVEASRDEAEYIRTLLCEEMEGAFQLSVRLEAEAGLGVNWMEAKA